jgi:hypothetical protein
MADKSPEEMPEDVKALAAQHGQQLDEQGVTHDPTVSQEHDSTLPDNDGELLSRQYEMELQEQKAETGQQQEQQLQGYEDKAADVAAQYGQAPAPDQQLQAQPAPDAKMLAEAYEQQASQREHEATQIESEAATYEQKAADLSTQYGETGPLLQDEPEPEPDPSE